MRDRRSLELRLEAVVIGAAALLTTFAFVFDTVYGSLRLPPVPRL